MLTGTVRCRAFGCVVLTSRGGVAILRFMQDTFLTVEEAARRLAVTPYTLREWLKAGRLHGVQVSKRWRIPERALTELATAPALPDAIPDAVKEEVVHQGVEVEERASVGASDVRRAAVLRARGSMKRPDYPNEVARFLEEKYADEARELATSSAGAEGTGAGA